MTQISPGTSTAKAVVIGPARSEHYEWVADLMERTLSPFYSGDHRAHAQRIFDTHILGGVDHVGHFSAGQQMFIAEVGGQPVGLLHVVEKKQETVKISPLIVDASYRGQFGIGSMLLDHAELFAISVGARQIYCTVASTNTKALEFFLRKGFRITGTAKSHYKQGVDEHMLYKQLIDDSGFETPSVSVVAFDEARHAEGVRSLVLSTMQGNFLGVDDSWVDALFAGYERRTCTDVNAKYKIIFVAECGGKVVGVAGATPKKGDPIKLMPLVASTESAFEALIIDLQGLLLNYGHKLYVHLVPQAWQVACLQRHGWALEGVFPGGYAPDSIVHQWGFNLNQEGMSVRQMRIKRPYYDAIMDGTKTLEVRVGYENIKKIQSDVQVRLQTGRTSGLIRVKAIRIYQTFGEMIAVEPWDKIAPHASSEAEVLHLLQGIYGPDKEELGVYVLEVEPVE